MIRSYSFSVQIFGEFKSQLERSLQHVDFQPTLAFAFVSSDFPLSTIMEHFKSRNIRLMGITTAGAMNFTQKEDQILEKGGLFTLTNLNPDSFHLESLEQKNKTWCDLGKYTGKKIKKLFPNPAAIFFTGGLETDGYALTEGILHTAGENLELYGSMAGDDLKFQHTYIFTETHVLEKGIVFLALDNDKINIHGMTTSGWIGLGNEFIITSCKENVIYEINHLSALDLYTSYLSISEDDLPAIGAEYPLMMKQSDDSFTTRMITGIDRKKRSIILSGSVPLNSNVSFSASPGFEILESTREKIINFHSRHQDADFMLIFSGVARSVALGPLVTTEVKLAPIKWKVPLAGFFGYGETGKNHDSKSRFCNQSLTLILLKDNSSQ